MRGHQEIIEQRKRRLTPVFVFLNDYPCDTNWFTNADYATVCCAGDNLASLDLSFLHGLKVSISSDSEKRARELFEACKQAGASSVAACQTMPGPWQTGYAEVWNA